MDKPLLVVGCIHESCHSGFWIASVLPGTLTFFSMPFAVCGLKKVSVPRVTSGHNRLVVRLDHVLERLQAGAALWLLAVGAGAVDFGNAGRRSARFQMVADFLVIEGMAETDDHNIHCI